MVTIRHTSIWKRIAKNLLRVAVAEPGFGESESQEELAARIEGVENDDVTDAPAPAPEAGKLVPYADPTELAVNVTGLSGQSLVEPLEEGVVGQESTIEPEQAIGGNYIGTPSQRVDKSLGLDKSQKAEMQNLIKQWDESVLTGKVVEMSTKKGPQVGDMSGVGTTTADRYFKLKEEADAAESAWQAAARNDHSDPDDVVMLLSDFRSANSRLEAYDREVEREKGVFEARREELVAPRLPTPEQRKYETVEDKKSPGGERTKEVKELPSERKERIEALTEEKFKGAEHTLDPRSKFKMQELYSKTPAQRREAIDALPKDVIPELAAELFADITKDEHFRSNRPPEEGKTSTKDVELRRMMIKDLKYITDKYSKEHAPKDKTSDTPPPPLEGGSAGSAEASMSSWHQNNPTRISIISRLLKFAASGGSPLRDQMIGKEIVRDYNVPPKLPELSTGVSGWSPDKAIDKLINPTPGQTSLDDDGVPIERPVDSGSAEGIFSQAVKAHADGDAGEVSKLLASSHELLRPLYEQVMNEVSPGMDSAEMDAKFSEYFMTALENDSKLRPAPDWLGKHKERETGDTRMSEPREISQEEEAGREDRRHDATREREIAEGPLDESILYKQEGGRKVAAPAFELMERVAPERWGELAELIDGAVKALHGLSNPSEDDTDNLQYLTEALSQVSNEVSKLSSSEEKRMETPGLISGIGEIADIMKFMEDFSSHIDALEETIADDDAIDSELLAKQPEPMTPQEAKSLMAVIKSVDRAVEKRIDDIRSSLEPIEEFEASVQGPSVWAMREKREKLYSEKIGRIFVAEEVVTNTYNATLVAIAAEHDEVKKNALQVRIQGLAKRLEKLKDLRIKAWAVFIPKPYRGGGEDQATAYVSDFAKVRRSDEEMAAFKAWMDAGNKQEDFVWYNPAMSSQSPAGLENIHDTSPERYRADLQKRLDRSEKGILTPVPEEQDIERYPGLTNWENINKLKKQDEAAKGDAEDKADAAARGPKGTPDNPAIVSRAPSGAQTLTPEERKQLAGPDAAPAPAKDVKPATKAPDAKKEEKKPALSDKKKREQDEMKKSIERLRKLK